MSLLPRHAASDPDDDNTLSGRFGGLKPWQLVAIFIGVVLGVLLLPSIGRVFDRGKAAPSTPPLNMTSTGEKWSEPAPPAPPPVRQVALSKPIRDDPPPEVEKSKPKPVVASGGISDQRMFGQKPTTAPPPPHAGAGATQVRGDNTELGDALKPTVTEGYKATRSKKPWATIEEGRIMHCNTVTPLTSQRKGFVQAKLSETALAEDGITPLLPRDSTLHGELAQGYVQGQTRFFVLWRSVRGGPPDYVRIKLNSPAADELGEAGLAATDINRHLWPKIGGALLLSGVQIGMQALGAGLQELIAGNRNNGSNNSYSNLNFYQFQGQGSSLASDLLRHQLTIPDELHRDHAQPCSVFTSGDLVFDEVYALRMRREAIRLHQ